LALKINIGDLFAGIEKEAKSKEMLLKELDSQLLKRDKKDTELLLSIGKMIFEHLPASHKRK